MGAVSVSLDAGFLGGLIGGIIAGLAALASAGVAWAMDRAR